MHTYKLIASDLDGTLLDNSACVSRENLDAIAALSKMGVHFVPCSGRTFSELPAVLKENENIRYVIHSNGAVVFDTKTGKRILNCLSNELCRKVLDILNSFKTHVTFRMNGKCYVDARFQDAASWDFYNVCEAHRTVVRDYAIYLEDFNEKSYGADNVEVLVAFFHDHDEKLSCIEKLKKEPRIHVVELDENNIEVVCSTAGKGNALISLCALLDIDISETISLGDSGNDISITQTAGLGLAMSNAFDSLKAVADEVICSNEEHVAKYILEHYFS